MDSKTAVQVGQQITDRISFVYGDGWGGLDPDSNTKWSESLLDRIVVLVGEQAMEYVSGYVDVVDNGTEGAIAVFTATKIVSAKFSAQRESSSGGNFVLQAKVSARARTAIVRVEVKSVSGRQETASDIWPHRVTALIKFDDESELTLPIHRQPAHHDDAELGRFLGTIL